MSGFDFLDLVLQGSDSLILNAAFQFCFIFFCLRGPCSVVGFVVLWFPCFVLLAKIGAFLVFFSVPKSLNGFYVKAMFSGGTPFLYFLLVIIWF